MKIGLAEQIALLLHPHVDVPGSLVVRRNRNVRSHNAPDVFEWLNPFSLGTMSASAYIENVA